MSSHDVDMPLTKEICHFLLNNTSYLAQPNTIDRDRLGQLPHCVSCMRIKSFQELISMNLAIIFPHCMKYSVLFEIAYKKHSISILWISLGTMTVFNIR